MAAVTTRISFLLFLALLILLPACGRRGDPWAVVPYEKRTAIGVVRDLEVVERDGNSYLSWGIPVGKDFPARALKGFVVFRAEVPEGQPVDECECLFRALDFVEPDGQKRFEYLDTRTVKGRSYIYKLLVMDKKYKMGTDSETVLIRGERPREEERGMTVQEAPSGLIAVYTQQSIILTWDEMRGKEIKLYKVYRSEGNGFTLIGETVTSVFNDKRVEPSRTYFYRVSAVGETEGPLSEEVEISTKIY